MAPGPAAWISRSNQHTQALIAMLAPFQPEGFAVAGIRGLDEMITDFSTGHLARRREGWVAALKDVQRREREETDSLVKQDLAILVERCEQNLRGLDLAERLEVPSTNVGQQIFGGTRPLLDPQVAPERHAAALVRLRKYTGLAPGTKPLVDWVEAEMRQGLANPALKRPSKGEIENEIERTPLVAEGVEKLFETFDIPGREPALKALKEQLARHVAFLKSEVLPKASTDFRLPPELYAYQLRRVGVDIPAAELTAMAHQAFTELQAQMQELAARIAKRRGLASADYRDVIRVLKKEQIPDAQVLAHYQKRLAEIESIIMKQHLVTLPTRPARIRLGTPAENAVQPAPHMVPARLVGNTGEQGEFVLPLSVPGARELKYDDFNQDSASWTLTAHEARPGHELQFARMLDTGTSLARAMFAFNSVNVEGWALYAESILLPFMPEEGQLISLQMRLQRAARAFLDPELQTGAQSPESASEVLQKEVVLSAAMAKQEVDRYTFADPAQATAYFYGYVRLRQLRADVEKIQGAAFNAQAFHDAVLAQGFLPPRLMRQAILGP